MNYFKWVNILIESKTTVRHNLVKHCLNAVRLFKKGEKSKAGEDCFKFLNSSDKQLIGFCPEISYIMVDHKDKTNLKTLWNHKFSIPTMLYHIKGTPFLLLANANLDYNNSKLLEIDDNKAMADELKWDGILG